MGPVVAARRRPAVAPPNTGRTSRRRPTRRTRRTRSTARPRPTARRRSTSCPYRNGPQSDPDSGPVPGRPGAAAGQRRGARGHAAPRARAVPPRRDREADRRRERRLRHPQGHVLRRRDAAGRDDRTPVHSAAFTLPADAPCGARSLAATAEDSLGQTARGHLGHHGRRATRRRRCRTRRRSSCRTTCTTIPPRRGRTVDGRRRSARAPRSRRSSSSSGRAAVCRDVAAPYQCLIRPRSTEIGSQTVRVVVTDAAGLTGQDSRQVIVPRFAPRGAADRRSSASGSRATASGARSPRPSCRRPASRASSCCATAAWRPWSREGRATLLDREIELDSRCRASDPAASPPGAAARARCATRRASASAAPRSWPPSARPGGSADAAR